MFVLHHSPDSAATIVRLVLEELGLPHEVRAIDRAGGALNSPAYRAMNPLGQIPALETPQGPMFETAAILLFLADGSALAPTHNDPARGQFLKWLFFVSTNVHPTALALFYPERSAGAENVAAVVAHARARLTDLLAILEGVAAERPAYLSDSQPTLLGYYIAIVLRWIADDFPAAQYPALHRVLSYLETRPAAQSVARAENLGPRPFTQST